MSFTAIRRGFLLRGAFPTMPAATFDLQGHRGARGLKPENTLPSFETALDVGVTSIETDVHLTADRVPVLIHDSHLSERLCQALPGAAVPLSAQPAVAELHLEQLKRYRADRNPRPDLFPDQDAAVTPLAALFAEQRGFDPYAPPSLEEVFAFVAAYVGELGQKAGKSAAQQQNAARLRFDLELKRVPFRPEIIGDDFDGSAPGELERAVVKAVRRARLVRRTAVRSFDHRAVAAVRALEPRLTTAVLVVGTAPVAPVELARWASADVYCPDFAFLDAIQVRQLHAGGKRVIPWTVNDPKDWERLLSWGVDGITTDFPDRLAEWLRQTAHAK
jgi:glycerophosphoryl diester phosphodiesterase